VLDIVEINKSLVKVDHGTTLVLPAVVDKDWFYRETMFLIERQNPIVKQIYGRLRSFGRVELREDKATSGVN
jgi:hypothetical protein